MRRAHWIAVAACLIAPALASAQTPPAGGPDTLTDLTAEERFMVLHGSVVAYERCMGESFDEAQAMTINGRIREVVGDTFGAGRTLDMIYRAKRAMNRTLSSQGCASDPIAEALLLFQTEIAPAMGIPAQSGR